MTTTPEQRAEAIRSLRQWMCCADVNYSEAILDELDARAARIKELEADVDLYKNAESRALEALETERQEHRRESAWHVHQRAKDLAARVDTLEASLRSVRLGHNCADCVAWAYYEAGAIGGRGHQPGKHHPSCVVAQALGETEGKT